MAAVFQETALESGSGLA